MTDATMFSMIAGFIVYAAGAIITFLMKVDEQYSGRNAVGVALFWWVFAIRSVYRSVRDELKK